MSKVRRHAVHGALPVVLVAGLASPGIVALRERSTSHTSSDTALPHPVVPPTPTANATGVEPTRDPLPPMPLDEFECRMPRVDVEVSEGCDVGLPYPACTWRVPAPREADRLYAVWRNTSEEHRSARPGLVSLVLAVAAEYARRYPGEVIALGDLDAPGPRHETHDRGVDIDVYLPGVMEVENLGGGELAENYAGLAPLQKRMLQGRVETLARIFAACSDGRVRILYNDPEVRARFHRWYDERGLASPFGRPMQPHNDLHRFHFHVTVPDDLDPLPLAPTEPPVTNDAEPPAS